MLDMTQPDVQLALRIAASAHAGQVDKSGRPYILHPITVASRLPYGLQPAGLLHDVVEDTDWTLDDLRAAGVGERTVELVDGMTQRKGQETYREYIQRIVNSGDTFLMLVKLIDVGHNRDTARWPDMPSGLRKRYEWTADVLREALF